MDSASEPDHVKRAPRRRRTAVRTVLVLALVLVAGVLGLLALHAIGHYRLRAALDRIRAAGEPVQPEELVFDPVGPGDDPTPWIAEVEEIELPWDEVELADPYEFAELLDRARAGELRADRAAILEELNLCYGGSDFADLFWEELRRALLDPGPSPLLSDCQLAALRAVELATEPIVELGLASCRMARLDGESVVREYSRSGELFPASTAMRLIPLLDGYGLIGVHEIIDGRERAGIERIHSAFCAAGLTEDLPTLHDHATWLGLMGVGAHGLRVGLSHLSPGHDLTAIEDLVREADPRASLHRALLYERTLGNRAFDLYRERADEEMKTTMRPTVVLKRAYDALWLPYNQAAYLRYFEEAISLLKDPYWVIGPRLSEWGEQSRPLPTHGHFSGSPTGSLDVCIENATYLETDLLVAQVALLAYREGIEEAIDLASATTDPFTGRPLRIRLDPDGALVIWSLGPDGRDDGGALHSREDEYTPPDVTWKIRLR